MKNNNTESYNIIPVDGYTDSKNSMILTANREVKISILRTKARLKLFPSNNEKNDFLNFPSREELDKVGDWGGIIEE